MKLAVITPGYLPAVGGLETHVGMVTAGLVRLGVDIEVWTFDRSAALPTAATEGGVLVRRFPTTSSGRFPVSPSLWRHARRHLKQIDAVHVHGYHASAAVCGLFAPAEVPLVVTPHFHGGGHSPLANLLHRPYRLAGHKLFGRATRIVAVSAAEQDLLSVKFPATIGKSVVIHNGASTEEIHAALPWPNEPPTLLVLGRMEAYKRVDRAIAAFSDVNEPGQLVILGDGPDRDRIAELAESSPRSQDIRLLGRVGDGEVKRWLRTARAVISLSEREAFGLVAVEAVAAGATAILSDLPAHRELEALLPLGTVTLVPTGMDETAQEVARALKRPHPGSVRSVRDWDAAARDHVRMYDSLGAAV